MTEQDDPTASIESMIQDVYKGQHIGMIRGIQVPAQSGYERKEQWRWDELCEDESTGEKTVREFTLTLECNVRQATAFDLGEDEESV